MMKNMIPVLSKVSCVLCFIQPTHVVYTNKTSLVSALTTYVKRNKYVGVEQDCTTLYLLHAQGLLQPAGMKDDAEMSLL